MILFQQIPHLMDVSQFVFPNKCEIRVSFNKWVGNNEGDVAFDHTIITLALGL